MSNNSVSLDYDFSEWEYFINNMFKEMQSTTDILGGLWGTFGWKDVMSHFSDEMGPDGGWKPLADSTLRQRAKMKKSGPILQVTGNLRNSILANTYRKEGDRAIRVEAEADYSGVHQYGSRRVPARPFMWLTDDAAQQMAEAFASIVMNRSSGNPFGG